VKAHLGYRRTRATPAEYLGRHVVPQAVIQLPSRWIGKTHIRGGIVKPLHLSVSCRYAAKEQKDQNCSSQQTCTSGLSHRAKSVTCWMSVVLGSASGETDMV
jgi:hypothetical protein